MQLLPMCTYLFSSVDDVLGERKSASAWTADDRVMPRWCMRHLHSTELQERLAKHHTAHQQLPVGTNSSCTGEATKSAGIESSFYISMLAAVGLVGNVARYGNV